MTKSAKFLFCLPLLLTTHSRAFPLQPPPPLDPDVVPIKMEKSDVADALEMLMWKFRVTTKKPNTRLSLQLSFLPLRTDHKLPVIPELQYVQRETTEEVLITYRPASDGLHYFIRAGDSRRSFIQEDKLEGWGPSYGIEDDMPTSRRMKDGQYLFEFVKWDNKPKPGQGYETLVVVMTIKPVGE